jgi:TolA-binding protein
MKILFLLFIILLVFAGLVADQSSDLKFIIGLYQDNNFRLAKTELLKFKDNYPESNYTSDVNFLLANIYLRARQYETAEKLYQELYNDPTVDINRPDILLGLAQTKYFQQDLNSAALLFNTFISEYTSNEQYWNALYFLGRIAVEQGEYNSGSYYYLQALENNKDPLIRVAQLELYLKTGNYSEARSIMEMLLRENPGNTLTDQALIIIHNYNLKTGNFEEILLLGYNSINLESPYYDDYKLILGITRYELGNYQLALNDLAGLRSVRADYYKALCYVELNETVKAVELFKETSNAENIEISSNSFFYLARLSADPERAITMLTEFINTYPGHIFQAAAYYQLGFNYFQNGNFSEAKKNLTRALELEIDADSYQKAVYLIAEADHQLNNTQQAYNGYNKYLELYPQGEFADEALFKLGLHLFEKSNYPEAFIKFEQLIEDYPQSAKAGMSSFYIGEMFFDLKKYFDAERHFIKAGKGEVDLGLVDLRLAQIKFFLKEYDKVESNLQNVPDSERYLFDKLILRGNLNFTRKQYGKALEAYDEALEYVPSRLAEERVMNRKAWTLYQMKDYSKAAEIYRTLSADSEKSSEYLLKAASSAFSAQNYSTSAELYKEFIKNYPQSENLTEARIGLANSYYNNGDFVNAALYYRELISPNVDREIMQNSLNGLRWSCEQEESIEYFGIINDILLQYEDVEFRTILLKDKIKYLNNKGLWSEILQAFNQFDNSIQDKISTDHIQIYRAGALAKLNRLEEAEKVFAQIQPEYLDADVYEAWANLKLEKKDEPGAIEMLRNASFKSRDYDIWLLLLELEQKNRHQMFLNDYNKFLEFAGLQEQEEAKVIWVKWKFADSQFDGLNQVISDLAGSKYVTTKANAQLLKGRLLYENGDFETAIPELLRVRYLYPEIGKVRIEAEYYACLSYIKANRKNEAEQLYDLIKAELTAEMKSEIDAQLKGDE